MNKQAPRCIIESYSCIVESMLINIASKHTFENMKHEGLQDVVVADTKLCLVDGQRGQLTICGHDVAILAAGGFCHACSLLWSTACEHPVTESDVAAALATGRQQAFAQLDRIGPALAQSDGMAALRTCMSHLTPTAKISWESMAHITGAAAVFVSAWWRTQCNEEAIAPDPELDHAADFLRMLDLTHDAPAVAALNTYLATVSEHGLNASTFACRVVISTGSDLVSGVIAAIGALKGPLHGGAPGPVLDMLDEISHYERVEPWLRDRLSRRLRIMGMGHRIYRTRDPRAVTLQRALDTLAHDDERVALAQHVETVAERLLAQRHPERALRANVEFFTATLLDALGLDRRIFATTFAIARVAGWCAHAVEQQRTGRLIRPRARYVGAA